MQAKISITKTFAGWLAVALIALAPLACIEYCRVTHAVAHRAMDHAAMMHDAGDAPLDTMQQLVQSVTDALPMLMTWFALMIFTTVHFSLCADARRRAEVPLTPPPKSVVFPLAFH